MTPTPAKIQLPPIERSVLVPLDPQSAFERFTTQFASWWPAKTHSVGGENVARIVFETRLGGEIYEEHKDGRRFRWGEITVWEPPSHVGFRWHPARDASTAQDVEVRFTQEQSGTRVVLTSWNWERWGAGASRARRGYNLGWKYVLNIYADRRTPGMTVVDLITAVVGFAQKLRGGAEASIAKARGEMPRA